MIVDWATATKAKLGKCPHPQARLLAQMTRNFDYPCQSFGWKSLQKIIHAATVFFKKLKL